MISVLILSLLLATIQAASPFCGPSSPSGLMVVALDGAGSGKSNICNEFNMDPADVTTSTANEASDVIFSCLGYMRHALINSYYGQTYDETCLSGYVSSTSPGLSIGVSPDCSSANAVLCKQRSNQAVVTPTITTTAATVTTTMTPTATATIPISYPTIPEDACQTPDGQFFFINEPANHSNASEICRNYGLYLADITNLETEGLSQCVSQTNDSYVITDNTVPGNFEISYMSFGGGELQYFGFTNVTSLYAVGTFYLCMNQTELMPGFEYTYHIVPSVNNTWTTEQYAEACNLAGFIPAVYSLADMPPIVDMPQSSMGLMTYFQMPVPMNCTQIAIFPDDADNPFLVVFAVPDSYCDSDPFHTVACRQWNNFE